MKLFLARKSHIGKYFNIRNLNYNTSTKLQMKCIPLFCFISIEQMSDKSIADENITYLMPSVFLTTAESPYIKVQLYCHSANSMPMISYTIDQTTNPQNTPQILPSWAVFRVLIVGILFTNVGNDINETQPHKSQDVNLKSYIQCLSGLVQERRNSSVLAMELRLSCTDHQCIQKDVLTYMYPSVFNGKIVVCASY